MIERATERRLAGDWPGACAAAGFNVLIDLDAVRRDHGDTIADRLEADLRHLAPDLLRWHLGPLRCRRRFPLAFYPASWALIASTPGHPGDPQRVTLSFERLAWITRARRDDVLVLLRDRWDSRYTPDKLPRCGGLTRLPFFTALGERLPSDALGDDSPEGLVERAVMLDDAFDPAEAWALAGYSVVAQHARALSAFRPIHSTLDDSRRRVLSYLADIVWVPDAPWHPRRHPINGGFLEPPSPIEADPQSSLARIELRDRTLVLDGKQAVLVTSPTESEYDLPAIPRIPLDLANRPPELTALLRGHLQPADLHPLVHAALFPAGSWRPSPPALPSLPTSIGIRCDNETHVIAVRNGSFVPPHSLDRERTLAALGGEMQGCAAAIDGWRDPTIAVPREMATLRANFLRLFAEADTAAVESALDAGLDPHVRDERGRTLLHLLPWLTGTDDLLTRLVEAGLDPNAADDRGRPPLRLALEYGSPDLVQALLAAGANPRGQYTHRPDMIALLHSPTAEP
ncbi:ankyrin repeat domain-containing protein [Dactylosporangium sp. CS-033363]|uniref:ankyrin repeat domain-containing protein n=1 Tax=Dactylosporangium sp. CS-033363 TaxID=3239935 RepID=UPI003D8D4C21